MAGNGKGFVWLDYLTAYQTAWNGLVELDEIVDEAQTTSMAGDNHIIRRIDLLIDERENPESAVIAKSAYEGLSSEAKEVLDLLINSPQEIINGLKTPKYDKVSREKVMGFLEQSKGWDRRKIKSCFKELKAFVGAFS